MAPIKESITENSDLESRLFLKHHHSQDGWCLSGCCGNQELAPFARIHNVLPVAAVLREAGTLKEPHPQRTHTQKERENKTETEQNARGIEKNK